MSEASRRRGETTREAILAAAESVFAQHGFAGARIDAIANISGYNKNLIFRYFDDKLGLYVQVLKRADREMGELLARMLSSLFEDKTIVSDARKFRTFLETMTRSLFDYLLEHPRFVRMLAWEMAEGWQTFVQIASQFPPEDSNRFGALLREAREAGLLRSDFAPVIQLSTALQVCLSYLTFVPLYQMLLSQEDISSVESQARAREYIVAFVVAGMMADPAEPKFEQEN